MNFLDTSVEFVKGVGPVKADVLKSEVQIYTFNDLMNYFPFRYVDRTIISTISSINNTSQEIQLKGFITNLTTIGSGRKMRLEAQFTDSTGTITLVWFKGIKWIKKLINPNTEYVIYGKPQNFMGSYNISHPELETYLDFQKSDMLRFLPVYYTSEKMKNKGLNSKGLSKITSNLFDKIKNQINENLPDHLLKKYNLISRKEAFYKIHFPSSQEDIIESKKRLKYEELFFLQLSILMVKKHNETAIKGFVFNKIGELFNNFYYSLPFDLTNAQKRVIKEIRADLKSGKQMNRLLQGDVGSGKTLVALMSMLIAVENGYQACLMAPTEILAMQHYKSISNFLKDFPVRVAVLTGTTKTKEKNVIVEDLINGDIDIIIGTHILIEEYIEFKNLGLAIIDEQHRFGVEQRSKLWKKNTTPPHILVMTATPIPRTLSMTVYGDLDYSVIDELPPGRKPVKTIYVSEDERLKLVFFLKEQIKKGHQIYVVYPLIHESEKLDLKDLMDGFDRISRHFPLPEYQVSIVHGQQKPDVQDYEMKRFIDHKTDILVATTVIEVGVDVPNATVMVIENAERFGLSQLHQLRGRIGRGDSQSYCILTTGKKVSNESKQRLATMIESNDGFYIAEADLKLRGPGDMHGTKQSGILDLKIADIAQDANILNAARNDVFDILNTDPNLTNEQNNIIKNFLIYKQQKEKNKWSNIS
ncbi:MAG: ATP-dependent DNA helicase RecG [Bacteroidales bacterium]